MLLNVGAAVQTGQAPGGSAAGQGTGAAPPLPPRRVVASQLAPAVAADPSATVSVTVMASRVRGSPRTAGPGPAGDAKPGGCGGADWRAQYQRATQEFDARRARLQAELDQRAC